MTKDEALKMAIEALSQDEGWFEPEKALQACKEALEQPSQGIELEWYNKGWDDAKKDWQGLSDDEINKIVQTVSDDMYPWKGNMLIGKIIRAIEQALKEKNT